ncbi:MAG: hypothetical protein JW786_00390 [Desulfobacterales bacterium]|nr:hypothetical protein [Desulfobacterales bacterium]
MNINDILSLSYEISRIYRSIDRKTNRLQQVAALRCPDGCGACCETQQIEATVLEAIPIAEAIFEQGEEISVPLSSLRFREQKKQVGRA